MAGSRPGTGATLRAEGVEKTLAHYRALEAKYVDPGDW
jgi:hypothetical protein